ncbi:hypothetical protein BH10CYA1_BH10CYA1_42140 [soil metagenome]
MRLAVVPAATVHEDLATLGGRDGGEEVLLDDALTGGGALLGHADVTGGAVGESSLLGGACGGAGGLVLAGGALLVLSHDGFPISPKWAGLADVDSFAW